MMGLLNGDRLNRRLVRCDNGFFIHVLFFASPSLWSELYQSDPLLADTLHTVEVYPVSERTRRSIVFIAEGYSLILSRRYHTVDLRSRSELIGGIQIRRFGSLTWLQRISAWLTYTHPCRPWTQLLIWEPCAMW